MRRLYQGKVFFMASMIVLKSQFSLNKFRNSYYRSSHQTLSKPLQIYLFAFLSRRWMRDLPFPVIRTPPCWFSQNARNMPQCCLIHCLSSCFLIQYCTATYTLATSCCVTVGEGILKAFLRALRKVRQSSGIMIVLQRSSKSSTRDRCSLDVGVISIRSCRYLQMALNTSAATLRPS